VGEHPPVAQRLDDLAGVCLHHKHISAVADNNIFTNLNDQVLDSAASSWALLQVAEQLPATAETRQALENIKRVLAANGSSMDDVVKCTAMLADIKEWAAMNEVYVTYFPHHLPARSAFATNGLVLGGRIELECMATRTEEKR